MTTAVLESVHVHDLWAGDDARPVNEARPSHLDAAAPSAWLWCFDCEHAFQVGAFQAEQGHGHCVADAIDFWQWEAYQAFTGIDAAPTAGVRFPLALAA